MNAKKLGKKLLSLLTITVMLFNLLSPSIALALEANSAESEVLLNSQNETTTNQEDQTTEQNQSVSELSDTEQNNTSGSESASITDQPVELQPSPSPVPSVEPVFEESSPKPESEEELPVTTVETNNSNAPPVSDQVDVSSPTPSSTPIAIPSPSAETINESSTEGHLTAIILENTDSESLELSLDIHDTTSASLTTDKSDYAPTDTAVIAGSNFPQSVDLKLIITSNNYRFETTISTDDKGSFIYAYQLDGTYRPLYYVNVEDQIGMTLASTSFTDSPASGCANDSGGSDDVPGQKDLTKMCASYTNLPTSVDVNWQWDDTSWSGKNTGDACALFDTNGNGYANYAVCVQVSGNPATQKAQYLYSCDDTSATNCLGNISLTPSNGTSCTASVQTGVDPFNSGNDTVASCNVKLADVGGSVATLTDVCTYPSASTPSNAADCIQFKAKAGKLTLTKMLAPAADAGLFNLEIDGAVANGGANLGHGGTTFTEVVSEGSHTIGETAGTNTDLSNYTGTIVCKDGHGIGLIVFATGTNPWTLNIVDGSDVLCTITNTLNTGSISGTKYEDLNANGVKDSGENGLAGWTIYIDANGDNTLSIGELSTVTTTDGTYSFGNLVAGTYNLREVAQNGWVQVSVNPAPINLVGGQNISNVNFGNSAIACYPNISKIFNISGAGKSEFSHDQITSGAWKFYAIYKLDGGTEQAVALPVFTDGGISTITLQNSVNIPVPNNLNWSILLNWRFEIRDGSNVLFDSGYLPNTEVLTPILVGSSCSTTSVAVSPVSVSSIFKLHDADGDGNVDPLFDDGLSGWEIKVTDSGNNTTTQTTVGDGIFGGGTTFNLDLGTYTISETQKAGWTQSFPNSNSTSLNVIDCPSPNVCTPNSNGTWTVTVNDPSKSIALAFGNFQTPKLTVTKVVTNDNGGTMTVNDFPLKVNSISVTSGNSNSLAPGNYIVSETGDPRYLATFSGDCDINGNITLSAGDNKSCTITNNDIAPKLTLNKSLINNNGGNQSAIDWTLTATGPSALSGTTGVTSDTSFQSGVYALSESGPSGYDSLGWSCNGGSLIGNQLTISLGEDITCTITNDDQTAQVSLFKVVNNIHGGNALADDFGLTINGTSVVSSQILDVNSNTPITLNEAGLPGYQFVSITGDPGCPTTLGGTVTLNEGEYIECYITNEDQPASITLIKQVNNQSGGDALADDFDLTIDGSAVLSGSKTEVSSNTPHTINETNITGYNFISLSGDSKCPLVLGGSVTLTEGEHISCIITNQDITPTLTLIKNVINDNGGDALADDFGLTLNGSNVLSGIATPVFANLQLTIDEVGLSGYSFVSITGDPKCPLVLSGGLTLNEGENVTCIITNDDISPSITLIKNVINDNGGDASVNDFGLTINGISVNSGDTLPVLANTPVTINEAGLTGYSFVSITGDPGCPTTLGGTVTLNEGEHITCTITNNDQTAQVSLFKVVNNIHGGNAGSDDFGLTIAGSPIVSSQIVDVNSNTPIALNEVGLPGYQFVSITGDQGCPTTLGGTVTLNEGDYIECYITNEDLPGTLIVKKEVVNNHGGTKVASDFSFQVNGGAVQSFDVDGENILTVDAGVYSIAEPIVDGYTTTYNNCSNVTVTNGQTQTCTITNSDQAGTIKINKIIKGPFFLAKDPGSFDILLDGTVEATAITDQQVRTNPNDPISSDIDGSTSIISINAGTHIISEVGSANTNTDASRYSKEISCIDSNQNPISTINLGPVDPQFNSPTPNPWTVNVANGQNIVCTITNIYPSLAQTGNQVVFIKHSLGGDDTFSFSGEQSVPGTLFSAPVPFLTNVTTIGGTNGFDLGGIETSFDTVSITVFPGFPAAVTLSEDLLPAGWSFDNLSCVARDIGGNPGLSTINITSDQADINFIYDEEVTCTFTNSKLPTLTVNKVLNPSTDLGKFNLTIDGASYATDISDGGTTGAQEVSVGSHTVGEAAGTGTDLSLYTISIGGDCDASGNITLAAGENKICTITNSAVPPVLTLTKSNNTSGDVSPGTQVLYTLNLNLSGNGLKNVSLVDLLPKGFKYKLGSWSAVSNIRGDLKNLSITTEPTYASPGTWQVGDMVAGETVTLSLVAEIEGGIDLGSYKDVSWAKGTSTGNSQILANDTSGIFVGTDVTVSAGVGSSGYQVENIENKSGAVLGASIELPDTGADIAWLVIAAVLLILGSTITVSGVILRRKVNE